MRALRNATIQNLSFPGACNWYLLRSERAVRRVVFYGTKGPAAPSKFPRRQRVSFAVGIGVLAAGVFATFEDEIKHGLAAVQRSGRVLNALVLNINEYRVALKCDEKDQEARQSVLKACHQRCADRTLRVLEKNGSVFIKFGQHLSSMNYLLPLEWTRTFIPLQDRCPVSSYDAIEELILMDTGLPIAAQFEQFDKIPIGAASLAQVHRAITKDTGLEVAVKVQHPALQEWVPLDLALTQFTFATLKYFFPEYDLQWLSDEMASSLPQELDFALEGSNAIKTKLHFDLIRESPLVIPEVISRHKRILVMEYLAGHRTDDLAYLDSMEIDRDEVSAALARIFNEMIFGNTPLHCDPHGGNIAIRHNSRRRTHNFDIVLYDHGLYRDIPLQLKRDYAQLWLAVIDADEKRMREYARRVAGINDEQFPLFASAITGRDFGAVTTSVISTRSEKEKQVISGALGEGMLQQLVQLLGQVPRIILLILKTNDLTRSLDESLETRDGPVRNFLILARYCSRTVFHEKIEAIQNRGGVFKPQNMIRLFMAWMSYRRVEAKLLLYEWYILARRLAKYPPLASI